MEPVISLCLFFQIYEPNRRKIPLYQKKMLRLNQWRANNEMSLWMENTIRSLESCRDGSQGCGCAQTFLFSFCLCPNRLILHCWQFLSQPPKTTRGVCCIYSGWLQAVPGADVPLTQFLPPLRRYMTDCHTSQAAPQGVMDSDCH